MPGATPVDLVRARLQGVLAADQMDRLPTGYFRVGDVLILEAPVPEPHAEVAAAYAQVLGMRSVLAREGRIEGELRQPRMRLLWGDAQTTTLHTENGVKYRVDPRRIMWSQGNLAERQRVATWNCHAELLVDFFAGVGYFTLPLARYTAPDRVVAIEKNPEAFGFLVENIELNGLEDRVEPVLGDCREAAPQGVADRVLLGYLPDALEYVPAALAALAPKGGHIHVHRAVPAKLQAWPAFDPVRRTVEALGRRARLVHMEHVKSYSPNRQHVVLDVEVRP